MWPQSAQRRSVSLPQEAFHRRTACATERRALLSGREAACRFAGQVATGVRDALGNAGTNTGSANWQMNAAAPSVVSVGLVTPDPRNTAVATVDVVMSELADLTTFDYHDLSLTRNGVTVPLTNAVTVNLVSGETYQVGGLSGINADDATYVLTVPQRSRANHSAAAHCPLWHITDPDVSSAQCCTTNASSLADNWHGIQFFSPGSG